MSARDRVSAFPTGEYVRVGDREHSEAKDGMSLRDYFAGQAIQLFTVERRELERLLAGDNPRHEVVADFCYDLADAMLAERERDR